MDETVEMQAWDSMTIGLIIALIIALVFLLIMALGAFLVLEPPPTHSIEIYNNDDKPLNVIVGSITTADKQIYLPTTRVKSKQSMTVLATPGTYLLVQAYYLDTELIDGGVNPFTTVNLTLAGDGYIGGGQMSSGENVVTTLQNFQGEHDIFDVSVQAGYNIPITIAATSNQNGSCIGPNWNHRITATGPNACPLPLQSPTGDYQVCLTPCSVYHTDTYCCVLPGACVTSCQDDWPVPSYYDVFADACPKCLITNCDTPNFTCSSQNGLTSYRITLSPI